MLFIKMFTISNLHCFIYLLWRFWWRVILLQGFMIKFNLAIETMYLQDFLYSFWPYITLYLTPFQILQNPAAYLWLNKLFLFFICVLFESINVYMTCEILWHNLMKMGELICHQLFYNMHITGTSNFLWYCLINSEFNVQ